MCSHVFSYCVQVKNLKKKQIFCICHEKLIYKKKRAALGARGDAGGSAEPDEAIDVEELERFAEKKKAAMKGKGKANRPSNNEPQESVPKKRKGVFISEPSQGKDSDNFNVHDEEGSEENDVA
ncbi:hypothetical protein LIER_34097 [Lithospermum erythrorhizon]|uniref:Uncharacterized protein n=1 Tax=Lithospermum erythrorhizon TaxID=34254 RepID=A0AAV3S0T0_LITER